MKICLFCGTFNPIHNAHLRIAQHVLNEYGFEKIIFIPTYLAPHKDVYGSSAVARFNMVKLAISDNNHFEISDIEFQSDDKSYTYNTISKLNDTYLNTEKWPFIIGTDAFLQIRNWYRSDELKRMLKFIVFSRENILNSAYFEKLKSDGYDFEFTNLDFCDISSTDIRNRVQNGDNISEFVPDCVKDYIYEHGLYREN